MRKCRRWRYKLAVGIGYLILCCEHLIVIALFVHGMFALPLAWKIAMSASVLAVAYLETRRTSRKYVLRQHRKEHLTKLFKRVYDKRRKEMRSGTTAHRPAA